ncbi:hypothetical protein [Segniliparus rugosus]|uniref:Uncharacterized protein n=1 Tax=Segniliparus rugosus (strain ATCC BAA-974 / DSM 45345 / CCUG 50838 / CIP 108380 / JCM 13579 / CDC 945) TaxID=679197 RepID=U1M1Q1_SEGRC|nr:hypothetical protein [Segniliparus rugosus]ERG69302.1 hypothetical protein HMPREF9336_04193 [Segniliparus rugosus ATCC BAA-974]
MSEQLSETAKEVLEMTFNAIAAHAIAYAETVACWRETYPNLDDLPDTLREFVIEVEDRAEKAIALFE